MRHQKFLTLVFLLFFFLLLMPGQALAEAEFVIMEEQSMPVPEEVLHEIDFSESRSIQQVNEEIEWRVFALVNQQRQNVGKPALQMDSVMRDICRGHSKDYGDNNLWDLYEPPQRGHYSPTTGWPSDRLASRGYTSGVHYTALSENYAWNMGYADPAAVAVNGWMNSPGHRRNMLDEDNLGYNYTGIGVYRASDGKYHFTQKFVRATSPLSSIITPPTDPPPTGGPPIPTLVSPANGSTVLGTGERNTIIFQWNASTGANRYQFRIRSIGAAQWQESQELIDPYIDGHGFRNEGTRFEWSVRAGNSAGQWSNWSSSWTFTNGSSQQGTFPDVPPSHPHYAGIEAIAARYITRGYIDGTFRPSQPVTRAEMATMLAQAILLPAGGHGTFRDVPPTNIHYDNIERIAAAGITRGYPGGYFKPSNAITRGEMATMLARAFELPPGGHGTFRDVPPAHVHYAGIEAIAARGITKGYPGGYFKPSNAITRGEMATMLARALGVIN